MSNDSMVDTCERLVSVDEIKEHAYNLGFFNEDYIDTNEDGEPTLLWMNYRHDEDVHLYVTKAKPDQVVIKAESNDEEVAGGPVMAVFSPEEFLHVKQFGTYTSIRWKKELGGNWRQPKNGKA